MSEELNLVRDLAVILVSAGIFTIISKALKQPLVLGYIIAGFLVGPHISWFPGIQSEATVQEWSEIGIIFLMFGLGLEFSFKKLLKVGSSALVTAGSKFVGVFVLGFVAGQALGWTSMESVFLGGLLSMSSTMVVLKSYDDMGLKEKPWAGMVFGTLVVEDLIAILLMVLLSTMAVSNQFAGGEMLFNLLKLAFFLILWFLVGIYVIPTLLQKARRFLSDEILLIVSIGLCFGMVALAVSVGFSSALGAFVMGSILAETVQSEHIEKLVGPIKDLFGAIFFVSVGMMVAPSVIAQYWWVILIITLLVIISHILFAGAGILMTGGGLENAVNTGFSLAQLGEFGFIIAGVGVSLGVMRDFIYPVIIAVSVITTFTTPYMIKLAAPTHAWLLKKLPDKWIARLAAPEQSEKSSVAEQSEWKKLLKAYFLRILLYGVILIAIMIGSKQFLEPLATRLLPNLSPFLHNLLVVAVTLLVMAPFLYGLAISTGSINAPAIKLLKEKDSNKWPIAGLILARSFIAISMVLSVIASHFRIAGWAVLLIMLGGFVFVLTARRTMHKYSALEKRFLTNLNEKEEIEKRRRPVTTSVRKMMAGYDVHLELLEVSPDCVFVGKALKEIPFRAETGANIIKIQRGSQSITIPSGDVHVYPHDQLLAVGTTEQIGRLRTMLAEAALGPEAPQDAEFEVIPITLEEDSYLTGKTLRGTNMRDYRCMVISVLTGGEFHTNPKPDYVFRPGDVVWIAGETSSCEWLGGSKE
ncbi:MAG: cation:proton antiporter [Bacteroidales bacterium]|nr:cation:proton antiporter [Bacteroidales bacterium]